MTSERAGANWYKVAAEHCSDVPQPNKSKLPLYRIAICKKNAITEVKAISIKINIILRCVFTPIFFTEKFNALYKRNRMLLGNDFNANSRRLGLISFRIAMVLRALRILEDGDYSNPLVCSETDFQTAIQIAFTLEKHAIAVFQNLPNNNLWSNLR